MKPRGAEIAAWLAHPITKEVFERLAVEERQAVETLIAGEGEKAGELAEVRGFVRGVRTMWRIAGRMEAVARMGEGDDDGR